MKDEYYHRAKRLIENIDAETKTTDEFKEILEEVKEKGATSKLYIYRRETLRTDPVKRGIETCIKGMYKGAKQFRKGIKRRNRQNPGRLSCRLFG